MATQTFVPTPKALRAVAELIDAFRQVVATRPEGYPAGELYSHAMSAGCKLEAFESLLRIGVRSGALTRRGNLLFAKDKEPT